MKSFKLSELLIKRPLFVPLTFHLIIYIECAEFFVSHQTRKTSDEKLNLLER